MTILVVQLEAHRDGNIHVRHVESLAFDLSHLLHVGLGFEGSLGQEDGMFFGGNPQLSVEGVKTIRGGTERVTPGPMSTIVHWLAGTALDGAGVVFGEAGLAHGGALVTHQTSNVLIPHVAVLLWSGFRRE